MTEIGAGTNTAAFASVALAAIDRTVFAATIVDAFLYDTEKDSDGGAWRKRCSHTSWEAETLSGNWLGSAANETAARLISGATTGSYYYDTTALGFYTLNAGSGKTATYRGNVRQFPAKVLITVEAARVVLWDLTQAGCPMFLVFLYNGSGYGMLGNIGSSSRVASSVAALNGTVCIGANGNSYAGLYLVSFVSDSATERLTLGAYRFPAGIQSRNSGALTYTLVSAANPIVNDYVNDVAMTVLPNAPVDVATGLPIPVIDVFTDAGTSRINTDGTVADLADTAGDDHKAGCILASGDSVGLNSTNGNVDIYKLSNTLADTLTPDRTYDQATVPALLEAVDAGDKVVAMKHRLAIGQDNGVNVLIENPASVAAGMIAYMSKDVPPMWQVGAIKGAWLADTVAETVTGAELVTNGTFATDVSGWTKQGAGTMVWDAAGSIHVTNDGSGADTTVGYQAITCVVGKSYAVGFELTAASVLGLIAVGTGAFSGTIASASVTGSGKGTFTFVATQTTHYLWVGRGTSAASNLTKWDNISCRLADVDRSVKAKGLQAFGSLTKAAVASGAALMGYSGFSAANYLEQPYNPDLDFGTGDFCIMGWTMVSSTGNLDTVFYRNTDILSDAPTAGINIYNYSGSVKGNFNGTFVPITVPDNVWSFFAYVRRSGVIYPYGNGAEQSSVSVAGTLTLVNAIVRVGNAFRTGGTGKVALLRASATAPSAEQIKHIYETERPMFEANAQCCLAGSSNAVTALAYDEETDLLHVGTSYGRSAFKGLVRTASEATAIGAITALAAGAGVIVQGGASGADVYVPAYTLREELLRDAEQMAKFGQNLIAHDFTATASQEVFTLPVGWEIVAVYQQGTLKRETTAWVRTFDGFKWSVDLVTGATVSDWISILAKRV